MALLALEDPFARSLPLHLTGSAVVLDPEARRVLLRWHERQGSWLQVGGHGDPGESDPFVVAMREAAEETGLADVRLWPGSGSETNEGTDAAGGTCSTRAPPGEEPVSPEITHLVIVPVPARGEEPAHEHADVRYLLATKCPASVVPESDSAPLCWVGIEEAIATVEPNLAETLSRVAELLQRL